MKFRFKKCEIFFVPKRKDECLADFSSFVKTEDGILERSSSTFVLFYDNRVEFEIEAIDSKLSLANPYGSLKIHMKGGILDVICDLKTSGKIEISGEAKQIFVHAADRQNLMIQNEEIGYFHQGKRGDLFLVFLARCPSFSLLGDLKNQDVQKKKKADSETRISDSVIADNDHLIHLFDSYEKKIETQYLKAFLEQEKQKESQIDRSDSPSEKLNEEEKRLFSLVKEGKMQIEEMEIFLKKSRSSLD